jgi:hypothetical protein
MLNFLQLSIKRDVEMNTDVRNILAICSLLDSPFLS